MKTNEREIRALVTLLADDEVSVQNLARKKLLENDAAARPVLEEFAFTDTEGRVRIAAQGLLEEMRLNNLADGFKKINRNSYFDLERACFILAQIEYPDLEVSKYVERIDHIADQMHSRIAGVDEEKQKVKALNQFLFQELGFRGDVKSYFDPQNSYINRVLDRFLGIPISLSALYLFVAQRLDLPVYGVGFPGHFLLTYGDDSNFFIDAFNNGRILSRKDCEIFLNRMGYSFYDSYLAISTPKEILARMIRNLVLIYHQNHQRKKIDTLEKIFSDFFTTTEQGG
jgi:regulator of sirC expression with transglutaminase-like and TPR domain